MPDEKPKSETGGPEWLLNAVLLASRIVASPLLCVRKWRGPRCESLLIRWLGIAAVVPVWASGGGGDPTVLNLVFGGLVFFTLFGTTGWRKAVRDGREISSRFVGLPFVCIPFGTAGPLAYLLAEPLQWGAVAALFALGGEPGWATYFAAAGVVAAPVEYLVIRRRDHTLAQDVIDARLAQHDLQDAVSHQVRR